MKYSIRGFILLAVLVFLHIFSLIGLLSFINVSTEIKSNVHQEQKNELMRMAKQILNSLEKQVAAGVVTCVIPLMAAAEMSKKPFSWWQFNTCHGNLLKIRYYYGIELLGNDACGLISQNHDNQNLIANFYRISLLVLPEKTNNTKIRLQSTMATSLKSRFPCQGNRHRVVLGRQMWREIE